MVRETSIIMQSKLQLNLFGVSSVLMCLEKKEKEKPVAAAEACSLICSLNRCLVLSLSGELRNEVKNEM